MSGVVTRDRGREARLRVAVLVSGFGSNLQALIDSFSAPDAPAKIVLVISNKAGVAALDRAARAGIRSMVVPHRIFPDRESFDAVLDQALERAGAELVCLAGFMRLLTPVFVEKWRDRMINIHPSLLPSFKGMHTHKQALEAGVRIHGCTVHFVRPQLDEGPIIVQATVPVFDGDTEESLAERVLRQEHRAYPLAVKLYAEGRLRVDGLRVAGGTIPSGDASYSPPPPVGGGREEG